MVPEFIELLLPTAKETYCSEMPFQSSTILKGKITPKSKACHHLLTLMLFQSLPKRRRFAECPNHCFPMESEEDFDCSPKD